jgi:hypothetical protein
MNKSYESNLKLNIKVNWKITTYTPSDFRLVLKIIKDKDQSISIYGI